MCTYIQSIYTTLPFTYKREGPEGEGTKEAMYYRRGKRTLRKGSLSVDCAFHPSLTASQTRKVLPEYS